MPVQAGSGGGNAAGGLGGRGGGVIKITCNVLLNKGSVVADASAGQVTSGSCCSRTKSGT